MRSGGRWSEVPASGRLGPPTRCGCLSPNPLGLGEDTGWSWAEASPRDVAAIIRQIRKERVPAVFLENISDPRQMQQIARESGARVGGKVYSDALSAPGGPAATYLDLMRSNLKAFDAALMPG